MHCLVLVVVAGIVVLTLCYFVRCSLNMAEAWYIGPLQFFLPVLRCSPETIDRRYETASTLSGRPNCSSNKARTSQRSENPPHHPDPRVGGL